MTYYITKSINCSYKEAIEKALDALKENGFGVLTEIEVQTTLKEKLDIDFPKYTILGACNPEMAHQALKSEIHIGAMLPCNVVIREKSSNEVEVFAVDPVASMLAVENQEVKSIAIDVRNSLKKVIDSIQT